MTSLSIMLYLLLVSIFNIYFLLSLACMIDLSGLFATARTLFRIEFLENVSKLIA